MSARLIALTSALLLCACATAQENPNYKFSSKYQGASSSPVQTASYETVAPVQTVATQAAPAITEAAPAIPQPVYGPAQSETEAAFDATTMTGTPGYEIMMAESEPTMAAPTTPQAPAFGSAPVDVAPARPQGARPISYDYAQNVIIADTPTTIAPSETRILSYGEGYTVQPGDTVYSLARSRCVAIADIAQPNGIGADYAIQIGQALTLPASRC